MPPISFSGYKFISKPVETKDTCVRDTDKSVETKDTCVRDTDKSVETKDTCVRDTTVTQFPFNIGHNPIVGEVLEYTNIVFNMSFTPPYWIHYNISMMDRADCDLIQEPVEMLMLSTSNPAHSLGEFTSFLEYYTSKESQLKVCINSLIADKMPYLYQLITLFIPAEKRILIEDNKYYKFSSVIMRRNLHFMYNKASVDRLDLTSSNNILHFKNLASIKSQYAVNCNKLFDKASEIYETHKHKYTLSDSIMIIKTSKEKYTVSMHRALEYPEQDVLDTLAANGIRVLEVSQFQDIYEYICTIYHAKNIIFSYGGPMCTNRFFCNPNANVIVLANLHYKHEYAHGDKRWHIRNAMLTPVKSQYFLLDFENRLTMSNIQQFLSLLV